MKKIFGLILFVILILSSSTFLFACKDKKGREYTTSIDTEHDIAELTLFTFNGDGEGKLGLMNLGHAFLSLKNTSSSTINLLNKTISSDETISFGTWSILQHFGVWYNVESNYIVQHNKYDGRLSITIGIDQEDIDTLCQFISTHDSWNPLQNCSNFALNIWNTVAMDSEKIEKPIIYTPSHIAKEIKKFENYEINKAIPTEDTMGYFDGSTYVSFQLEGDNYASV